MKRACSGCTRSITVPVVYAPEHKAIAPRMDVWTCGMCGARNEFPIMVVLPHPQTQEASK